MSKAQNKAVTNAANNLSSTSSAMLGNNLNRLNTQQGSAADRQKQTFDQAFTGFGNAANTGGFDPTSYGATLSGYQDMAQTGGFSPQSEQQYMRQATSGVANTYNVLEQQRKQQIAKTGGLGGSGELSQMARHLAQDQSSAEQSAAVNLNQLKTQNKLAGLQGSTNLQSAQAANKLSALSGMGNLFNTSTGEFTQLGQQMLDALGIDSSNQKAALDALTALATSQSSSKGILGTIQQIGGMVGGGLSAFA